MARKKDMLLEKRFSETFPNIPSTVVILPNPKRKPAVKFEIKVENSEGLVIDSFNSSDITRAPGTKFTVMAMASASKGGFLETGLTDYVANPYKSNTSFKSTEWEKIFKDQEFVLREHVVEYFWNKPIGYYTNEILVEKVPSKKSDDAPVRFFQTEASMFELEDGVTSLDLSTELGMIKYFMALADPLIANSYEELNPETLFYIARKDEEDERKAKSSKKVDAAVARLFDLSENFPSVLIKMCKVLGIQRKNMSESQAYDYLSNEIKRGKDFVENFVYYYDLWKEESTRPVFEARVFLWDLLETRVVTERSGKFTWYPPREEDGRQKEPMVFERREEFIDFLTNDKFRKEHAEMQEQIKANLRYA